MKGFFRVLYFVCAVLVITSASFAYIVKKGDTLSKIAFHSISTNVYGFEGSLKKLIRANPTISNPNNIFPGQMINLPEEVVIEQSPIKAKPTKESSSESRGLAHYQKKTFLDQNAYLNLTPQYSLMGLSASDRSTGSSSTIASKYYLSLKATYQQEWSESLLSAVYLKLSQVEFERPTQSDRSLVDEAIFLSSLGMELTYKVDHQWAIRPYAEYGKELFIRAATTAKSAVDAIDVPTAGVKAFRNLVASNRFVLGISGSYALKLPAKTDSYDVNLGHEYAASLYLNQLERGSSKYFTEIGIKNRKQNTNVTTQNETNLFLGVTITFGSVPESRGL